MSVPTAFASEVDKLGKAHCEISTHSSNLRATFKVRAGNISASPPLAGITANMELFPLLLFFFI